ncbi:MAG: autotransporter outer membrane beta-barrel domain-containing protein [Acidaminococcus sp.]|nr:autotransporter outer membrane beta-barrel domain-containing protein [Acidaminococcus sp.]
MLLSLSSGRAYAAINYGQVYADGGRATIQGNGTIIFSSTSDSDSAIYANNGAVVAVGSTDTTSTYENITANGEVLADNSSKISLYADTVTLNRSASDAAVTASDGSTITIGSSKTTSITTTGEVLATDDNGSASTITLTADDITMNYSPNSYYSTEYGGDEDHTLYADGGSSITVTATDDVDINGPIGAVGSGSSINVDGSDISITHNTVGTGNYELETEGIHVESGASIRIGSDSTESLTIDVENGSGDSTIVVDGNASTLNLYGNTISVTTTDGILNGDLSSTSTLEMGYAGGTLNIGTENTESITISGVLRTVGSGAATTLLGSSITTGDVATYHSGTTTIGSASTDTVIMESLMALYNSTATVLGDLITLEAETYEWNGRELTNGYSVYSADGSTITIGSDDTSKVTVEGHVEVDGADLTIKGNEIVIGTTGTSDLAIEQTDGGTVTIGDDATESVLINSAILIEGDDGDNVMKITGDAVTLNGMINMYGSDAFLSVDGTNITLTEDESIDPSDMPYAVSAMWGSVLSLGSSRTESLSIVGQVVSWSLEDGVDTEVNLDGQTITLENGALATGNGAVVTIGGAGVTETLTGDLTATDEGVLTATLSGTYTGDAVASDAGSLTLTAGSVTGNLTSTESGSTLTADVSGTLTGDAAATDSGTLTLSADSIIGDISTSDSGVLTATVSSTFTGAATDDADTMTLNLESGSTWNLTDSSTVNTLNADGAAVNLMDGTLGQTLTMDTFAGDGATVYLDADGSTNTGNDHVYVTGTHTGTTYLHLSSTSNTWSGALGTVLASVGDEQGSFVSDGETEAALYYYDLKLMSTTDNVTDGYNTDWYLGRYTKNATNSEGHHTTVVRNLGGIAGSNYLLWRSDMDTLFRRLGEADGTLTPNTDNGIWARAKGKKFSRVSDFLVNSKYNEYEVGYDWLHEETDKKEHVMGVGFAYLDGDSTYVTGKGDLTGYTLGLYDTQVWKDGQYLDITLKGSRYENEFDYTALGRGIEGESTSTGFSLGAEYGYKRKSSNGWFVEPQAQFVLGHFSNDSFTDSNGVHVDGETIRTALGRIGARVGYESPKFSVYAKANWYHDFGGNHVTTMSVDTDSLRVHEDYGDTWFSYGLGAAYKINDKTQAYFDLERGDGSTYDENWSWDVGLKFNF